jgi:hypothetical protein
MFMRPLLAPEIAAAPRAAYSFQDVLALRTFVRLRENTSLQKIRTAIGNLRNIGEVSHLASYRLVAGQGGNIQLLTATEAVDLGKNPGQLQLVAGIGDVIEPFAARAGVLVPHLLRPRPCLAVDPETQGGTPVMAGTRVPYDAVAIVTRHSRDARLSQPGCVRRRVDPWRCRSVTLDGTSSRRYRYM